jgi:PKD repeat protein
VLDWTITDGTTYNDMDTIAFDHVFTGPGDYTVTMLITDQNGCTNTETKPIHVSDSAFINMPNILVQSSNIGNNKVDLEEISPLFNLCVSYTYTIFDRWGVMVFKTTNDAETPDTDCYKCFTGKANNGAVLTPGVYYYVIEGNFSILKSGSITIFD